MRRFVKDNSLSLFFLALFLLALMGQSIAGYYLFNEEQREHGEATIGYFRYLVTSDFGANVLENWQSEWLQFWLFALATVWLVQKGSNESKELGSEGLESDQQQKGQGLCAGERAPLGESARLAAAALLPLVHDRDGPDLPRDMARGVVHELVRLQRRAVRA